MDPEFFPGDVEVVAGNDKVRDVKCFCTGVVVPTEVTAEDARAALAYHLRDSRAHGLRFSNATADDLIIEPPHALGRARVRWMR
jgi:hypothetical protein